MKFCGKHIGEDDTFRVSTVAETIKKKNKKNQGSLVMAHPNPKRLSLGDLE